MQDTTHILPGGQVVIGQNPGAPWHANVIGDFDGDGKAGILFTTDAGQTAMWDNFQQTGPGQGQFLEQSNLQSNGPTWHAKFAGDFDADGKDDILWQNDNGAVAIWLMDGDQIKQGFNIDGTTANGPSWKVAAVRDMDADLKADIIFQNDVNGAVALWEDFKPVTGNTALFETQNNIVPDLNPTGHLYWHVL
jgi:serralysin